MRILLVEDDKVLADALSRALVQSAHAVDSVSTGRRRPRANAGDLRSGHPGHRPARPERPGGAQAPARPQVHHPGADAHRLRHAGGPGARPGPGRRRLPVQAAKPARAGGPRARCCAGHAVHALPGARAAAFRHGRPPRLLRQAAAGAVAARAGGAGVAADARGPRRQQGADGQPPLWLGRRGGDNAIEVYVYRLRKKLEPSATRFAPCAEWAT